MTHEVDFYPHNDLLALAYYHLSIVNEKIKHGENDALSLDCMSCVVALAFGVEAFVNFIGHKKIPNWATKKERDNYINKMHLIYETVGGNFDETKEPYLTVKDLKKLRDLMAHGKPVKKVVSVSSHQELWSEMATPWSDRLNHFFINHAHTQVKAWQRELLELSGIDLESTITIAKISVD